MVEPEAPPADGGLLERGEAMSKLRQLLAEVRSEGAGRLVWVGGEAGVGKTALLSRFCRAHDGPVLWGACEPLRTPRPLGPFMDVAEATGDDLAELFAGSAKPHEVATALIAQLRGRRATVLVLEDLHWADEATLDVVTMLAARASSAPVLALASYRDDELARAPNLRFLLGEVTPRPARVKLEPLSPEGVASLAAASGLDAGKLYALTGGNPFFVTEVLAAGTERLPETVRDAVLARAARLPEPARELLQAVAIVPGEVDLSLLQSLATRSSGALKECLSSGVLTVARNAISFRHELARVAVEESILPTRRIELHQLALAALEHDGDRAHLAYHAEAAGDAEAVLRWAPMAAEHASLGGSHREAAAQYERALRFGSGLPLARRTELLRRRANECWLSDQFDAAIEAQEEALACLRLIGDRLGEGDVLRTLSRLMFFVGRVDDGEALAWQAVELLEQLGPSHELAMAYGNLSQRRMVTAEIEEAVSWGERALELAERLDDSEVLVYALTNTGAAKMQAGLDAGRDELERALELALRRGLDDYAGRAFMSIVRIAADARSFDVVDEYAERAAKYCHERGLDTWRLYLLAVRATTDLARGRWDEAADGAALVLRDPRSAALPRGQALTTLGKVRARRGDPGAEELFREEHDLAWRTHEVHRIGAITAARAEAAWLAGDLATVLAATEPALSLAVERHQVWVAGEIAYWRRQAGARDQLGDDVVAEPYRLSIGGDWAGACELWRKVGCPYEAALALADSDDERALRQALDELQSLGAAPAAAIVARRLRERGVRGLPRGPRRTTRENPAGLTARELDVLALVAEGLRNAEIAQRLVVSEKTVDHHVSSILRKLDATSRGGAAAAATRLGIIQAP